MNRTEKIELKSKIEVYNYLTFKLTYVNMMSSIKEGKI